MQVNLTELSHARIIVAGDVMLDRYWYGEATRISPEAPVPVVHCHNIREAPGGAANVASNVAHLGAKAVLLSVVGDDREGIVIEDILRSYDVDPVLLRDPSVPTTVKVRVIAQNQQVVRVDFEGRPDHELLLPLVNLFCERLNSIDAVIFSDYRKGGLAHVQHMMDGARRAGVPILVDPKGEDYSSYRGATSITPNREEFALVAGRWDSEKDFERRAFALRDSLGLVSLLVTRSEEGMSLFVGERHIRIPTHAREVFDVSGAGDTVIATMATAIAAGYDIETAARIANIAAGIVVSKLGTVPITIEELVSHV